MPDLAIRCIESWKRYLPEYELVLWNEKNFDISSVPYVKEAYEAKKFAFVTDYVRLYALFYIGGIYMDIDVEILKPLDDLLHLPAFSGFESETEIPTGIMASEKYGAWASEMLSYYHGNRHFLLPDGQLDMTTNVKIISDMMAASGFELKNGYQVYKNCMHIFPKEYFCPKERIGKINLTDKTYCIHHFEGSWHPRGLKIKKFLFRKLLGPNLTELLVNLKWVVLGIFGVGKEYKGGTKPGK